MPSCRAAAAAAMAAAVAAAATAAAVAGAADPARPETTGSSRLIQHVQAARTPRPRPRPHDLIRPSQTTGSSRFDPARPSTMAARRRRIGLVRIRKVHRRTRPVDLILELLRFDPARSTTAPGQSTSSSSSSRFDPASPPPHPASRLPLASIRRGLSSRHPSPPRAGPGAARPVVVLLLSLRPGAA